MEKKEALRKSIVEFLNGGSKDGRIALDKVKDNISALWKERGIMKEPSDKCALYIILMILKDWNRTPVFREDPVSPDLNPMTTLEQIALEIRRQSDFYRKIDGEWVFNPVRGD